MKACTALFSLVVLTTRCFAADGDWLPTSDGGATTTLHAGSSEIALIVSGGEPLVGLDRICTWVQTAARAVTAFYGHYPVKAVTITITIDQQRGAHGGHTYDGRWIHCCLGRDSSPRDLSQDWIMTHEMFHLGFPDLDRRHLWLEEGLSTYLEPLARARIGALSVDEVWRGMITGMPNGLPQDGDAGLDRTPTWGRTYWGGCLFCLLADLAIRERSGGRFALDDGLQAILQDGGDGSEHWTIARVLRFADAASQGQELSQLYQREAQAADDVDLPALWRKLGVGLHQGTISYDDHAPWAGLRRALTTPRPRVAAAAATSAAPTSAPP